MTQTPELPSTAQIGTAVAAGMRTPAARAAAERSLARRESRRNGPDLLTTAQAAEVAGITPAAFRKAASTDPALREAKTMIDGRTPGYPRTAVEAWRTSTPRRARIVGALMLAAVAFALTACGTADDATLPAAERSAAAPVVGTPAADEPVVSESEAVEDCWTDPSGDPFAWRTTFNEISGDPAYAVGFLESLPEPSEGCTDVDRDSLTQAAATANDMRTRFPDLF